MKKIVIGADYKGFELKEKLKDWFVEKNWQFEDVGGFDKKVNSFVPIAITCGERVVKRGGGGVVICGSGVGVGIAANKVRGARCGLGFEADQVRAARMSDDINVLALAADYTGFEKAKKLIEVFLEAGFEEKARRISRLSQIKEYEENRDNL